MDLADLQDKKLFVLDTNVLAHDPAAIFNFQEHNIFMPMVVLEELDHLKTGSSDTAQNARQVSRFFDELLRTIDCENLQSGIDLNFLNITPTSESAYQGKLYFQAQQLAIKLPDYLPGDTPDNSILATALGLQKQLPDIAVILVSRDINLRLKASILGVAAEDYQNAKAIDDIDLLYSGSISLDKQFWNQQSNLISSTDENGETHYIIDNDITKNWYPNQFVYSPEKPEFQARVLSIDNNSARLAQLVDYQKHHQAWGIHALSPHQNYALNMLLDPNIDFVSLLGAAGTGKTLLALAAGLQMTLETNQYSEILMTRETIGVGEDIGFLPGSEEEKMAPWMGALHDNLELLGAPNRRNSWESNSTDDVLLQRIKIRSLNFMRGRTFLNRYIIIDEAQNLTVKQMKTLITRSGPRTKFICLGNIAQIDAPYLSATTSGLTFVVDRFKNWQHSAHITLTQGERSRLADFASTNL